MSRSDGPFIFPKTQPKIVQIAISALPDQAEYIYALDSEGRVWMKPVAYETEWVQIEPLPVEDE